MGITSLFRKQKTISEKEKKNLIKLFFVLKKHYFQHPI